MTLDVSTLSVIATLRLHAIIGIALLLVFEYVRRQREIYAPKLRSKSHRCPQELPQGYFAWARPLLDLSEEDTLKSTGLDGFVFLRFLKMCTKMALGCGTFALVLLAPVYHTSPTHQKGVVGIMLYTMANIDPQSDRLWAPFLCTYFFTFYFLYLLYHEYNFFVRLRQDFMRDGDPDIDAQQLYSVIVENIPRECQSSKKLQALFEELFPGDVSSAKIAMKYGPIIKAEQAREKIVSTLENCVAAYEACDRDKAPMVKLRNGKVAKIGFCGNESAEAIPFYEKELSALNEQVSLLKQQAQTVDNQAAGIKLEVKDGEEDGDEAEDEEATQTSFTEKSFSATGFVTFTSLRAQAAAYQVAVLSDKYPKLKAFPADSPHNTIWSNVFVKYDQIQFTLHLSHTVYYIGLIFWATIVSVVSAFSQLSNLEKYLPFLKSLDDESYALLEGQLPVLCLVVLMALLPIIFKSVGTFLVKQKTISEINADVFEWFYLYQLANVYLMLFAGSLLGAISDILDNPMTVAGLLAAALPGVATFFINLLLTMTLSGVPIVLLRIAPLALFKLQVAISNPRKLTKRALMNGPLAPNDLQYHVEVPRILYVLCIALLYMVIAPIATFVAGLFFAAYFVTWKYQLCYVLVPEAESGGKIWYRLFKYSMIGLMMSTCTMIGYMGIKQGIVQTPLLMPLPVIVYVFWGHCKTKFEVISGNAALSQTVIKDTAEGEGSSAEISKKFDSEFFLPPQMKTPAVVEPLPYRINDEPLLDSAGCLNKVYFDQLAFSDGDMECPPPQVDKKKELVNTADGNMDSPQPIIEEKKAPATEKSAPRSTSARVHPLEDSTVDEEAPANSHGQDKY